METSTTIVNTVVIIIKRGEFKSYEFDENKILNKVSEISSHMKLVAKRIGIQKNISFLLRLYCLAIISIKTMLIKILRNGNEVKLNK
ncbi:hypothetical protein CKN94_04435 [Carnobacterium maltaromaticum]|nr:hypothetical protein CKN94_04435 [Carnobacterium maltaromaticum]TFJ79030.1 hypothetical protein CKN97_04430 [Carnobacterium maltaromaticum]